MRERDDGLELSFEDLTESLYRAWCAASGDTRPWDDLGGDQQARWFRAVRGASVWLPGMDGQPAAQGAQKLLEEWAGDDEVLRKEQVPYLTEWEACVRHLNVLLDSDELEKEDDVRALEASWTQWVQRKPRRLVEKT